MWIGSPLAFLARSRRYVAAGRAVDNTESALMTIVLLFLLVLTMILDRVMGAPEVV
jgi:hypothetical protein